MTHSDALTRLALATNYTVPLEQREVYLERLSPYDDQTVAEACRRLETSATFFPKLAEIVEMCRAVRPTSYTNGQPQHVEPISKERAKWWMDRLREDLNRRKRGLLPARVPGEDDY